MWDVDAGSPLKSNSEGKMNISVLILFSITFFISLIFNSLVFLHSQKKNYVDLKNQDRNMAWEVTESCYRSG